MWYYYTWYWKEVCAHLNCVCLCVCTDMTLCVCSKGRGQRSMSPHITLHLMIWVIFSPFPEAHRLIRVTNLWVSVFLCLSSTDIPAVIAMTCFWCDWRYLFLSICTQIKHFPQETSKFSVSFWEEELIATHLYSLSPHTHTCVCMHVYVGVCVCMYVYYVHVTNYIKCNEN